MVLMKAIVFASLRITKKEIFPMEPKNGANESNCLSAPKKTCCSNDSSNWGKLFEVIYSLSQERHLHP
jgi:hypothetical protein